MGIADVARDKAQAAVTKATDDVADLEQQLAAAEAHLTQVHKAADAGTEASRSETKATIADLQVKLTDAKTELTDSEGAAGITEKLTSSSIVHGATEGLRQTADADVAKDQAAVDQLEAQISQAESDLAAPAPAPNADETAAQTKVDEINRHISAAKTRLSIAEKALAAIDSVTE